LLKHYIENKTADQVSTDADSMLPSVYW